MKIEVFSLNEALVDCKEIVQEVSQKFIDLLSNKSVFNAKLSVLNVKVFPFSEDITTGACAENGQHSNEYSIHLLVNPNDSKKYIAFVIAHELAHLHFYNLLDPLKQTGLAEDGSRNSTAITRTFKDNTKYGNALEEMCADYIACFVVSKLNLEDKNNQFETYLQENKEKFEFIEFFSSLFGESLSDTNSIDAYEATEDNAFIMHNKLWYCISTFSLDEIVNDYDNHMGKKSFWRLNEHIEKFFKNDESEKKLSKQYIYNELTRYSNSSL